MNKEFERQERMKLQFERQEKMRVALAAGNDRRLTMLIKEDTGLASYYWLLRSVVAKDGDPVLVKKLLDHPAVDKTSQHYKSVVANIYSDLCTDQNANPEILKLLMDKVKDEQRFNNQSLSMIFSSVVKNCAGDSATVEAAKRLVENGADLTKVVSDEEAKIDAEQRMINARRAALNDFKAKVTAPRR